MSSSTEASVKDEEVPSLPLWLQATVSDIHAVDVDAPLVGCIDADSYTLAQMYLRAFEDVEAGHVADQPADRVYRLLAAAMQMHFKPRDRHEPFGPRAVMADGSRTAIPTDFRGHVDVLSAVAEKAKHPVLKARIADLGWLLDRRRAPLGFAALTAYVEIVVGMEGGKLKAGLPETSGALHHESGELLRRALWIGQSLGRNKSETIAAQEALRRLRKQSLTHGAQMEAHRFGELDLDFGVSDPAEVAADLETLLAGNDAGGDQHSDVELWRLAARAHALAKAEGDRDRCLSRAADVLVAQAEAMSGSAILSSHFLEQAIAQLGRLSGQRGRRQALRHKLVNVQANAIEEMTSFAQEVDITDIVDATQKMIGERSLFDQLFIFAYMSKIPEPTQLREEAIASIREHPLSSLFPASYMDREGKVIRRMRGGLIGHEGEDDAILTSIAQREELRRSLVAKGEIEAARTHMNAQHMIDVQILEPLLQQSPFVPDDLVRTFSTGFAQFFQGDFICASYVLTPLLENSLRHVLKNHGHDVTTLDDTDGTQKDRTISLLYEQMRPELDAIFSVRLTSDIERVFLQKPGPYLRHALAHGLLTDGDPFGPDAIYGCWLMWHLCLMPLVPHRDELRRWLTGSDLLRSPALVS